MPQPYIEERDTKQQWVSIDVARHLFTRYSLGTVLILTERPRQLIPSLKKEWIKIERAVVSERSKTLDQTLATELQTTASAMRELDFTLHPHWRAEANVHLLKPEEFLAAPFSYRTLYVAEPLEEAAYRQILSFASPTALVVRYNSAARPNMQ